ncbi:MAG: HNH endonuclease [bacterium]|nr:HNH endonuclease [bacterium]
MNRWKIPKWLEAEVMERDTACVYCGVVFGSVDSHGSRPSWEHIINDAGIVTRENIALCCRSCNSSKGARLLADWIASPYCKRRGISYESVTETVKKALLQNSK